MRLNDAPKASLPNDARRRASSTALAALTLAAASWVGRNRDSPDHAHAPSMLPPTSDMTSPIT